MTGQQKLKRNLLLPISSPILDLFHVEKLAVL
jgi:hypothetical protein